MISTPLQHSDGTCSLKMKQGIIAFAFCIVMNVCAESGKDVSDLIKYLFKSNEYNKNIRPITDQNEALTVQVDFVLNSITEFDEQKEMISTSGYFHVKWTDEYLVWNKDQYNGTTELYLPQDDIWKPDLVLANSYKSFTGMGYPNLNMALNSSGYVQWVPNQVLESTCSVNIRYFPFDEQTCVLKINAWSYSSDDVRLSIANEGIDLTGYSTNSQWDLLSTHARVLDIPDESAVEFELHLKRRASFYVLNIIVPVLLLSLLGPFAFVLPADSGERSGYAVTMFLSLAVFLTIIASELPKNSEQVSYISVYLISMTACNTVILAISLAQVRLVKRDAAREPVGPYLRCLYRLYHGLRCAFSDKPTRRLNVVHVSDAKTKERTRRETNNTYPPWPEVMNALDFLMFWLFIIITVICTVVLYLVAFFKV